MDLIPVLVYLNDLIVLPTMVVLTMKPIPLGTLTILTSMTEIKS
ncbi:MAG: hypothetical protein PHH86_01965 [Sphaerochaetaceae bacterium]|jgi:hypothetical protein|nr:hypothetical protein [Sphaerochaetaceae bacterium]